MNTYKGKIADVQGKNYIIRAQNGTVYKIPISLGIVDYKTKIQVEPNIKLILNDEEDEAEESNNYESQAQVNENQEPQGFIVPQTEYTFSDDDNEDETQIPNMGPLPGYRLESDDEAQTVNVDNDEDSESQSLLNPNKIIWTNRSIRLLLSSYKEKKPLVEKRKIKTLKRMWELIKDEMVKKGYFFSVQQIENKWKSLERAYKNMLENKKKTGRGRRTCPYQEELADILSDRASIFPPAVIDQNRILSCSKTLENSMSMGEGSNSQERSFIRNQEETIINIENEDRNNDTQENARAQTGLTSGKKRKRVHSNQQIKELKEAIENRTNKFEEVEEKKYHQRERIYEEIKRKNDLFEKYLIQKHPV